MEYRELTPEEQLRADNDFLKMKIMLELGGRVVMQGLQAPLSPEVENRFLRTLIEWETQSRNQKKISVYEKLGKPAHFLPPGKVGEAGMAKVWEQLDKYMRQRGICLDVCSPNIPPGELYRFAIEELFAEKIIDMNMPDMSYGFIYDEFYPDDKYDNEQIALDYCIGALLSKEPMKWMHHYKKEGLRLNGHYPITGKEFRHRAHLFQEAYDDIKDREIKEIKVMLSERECTVTGIYAVTVSAGQSFQRVQGTWKVDLERTGSSEGWYISGLIIDGLKL